MCRHIQRDRAVEAAIQREYSQVLAISEKQINHKAYELVDDVRKNFPRPVRPAGRRWTRFWLRIPTPRTYSCIPRRLEWCFVPNPAG